MRGVRGRAVFGPDRIERVHLVRGRRLQRRERDRVLAVRRGSVHRFDGLNVVQKLLNGLVCCGRRSERVRELRCWHF